MRMQVVRTVVLSALVLLASHIGRADTVTLSATGFANFYPFGASNYTGEYQQVYSSSLFSGPVEITAINFFAAPGFTSEINGDYTLDLSTTTATPGTLSTSYSSNIGSDNTVFFDGAVSNTLTFTGTPFLYDPSQGDLLLDVVVHTPNIPGATNEFVGGCSADTNRVFNFSGAPGTTALGDAPFCGTGTFGLETAFTVTPVASTVPEPSALTLLGTGLLSLTGLVRRRTTGR